MGNVKDVAEKLDNARSRLAPSGGAGDFVVAFDALLAAWRSLRAAELAELCEILSERAARNNVLIETSEKKHTECVVAWMKAFHERTALGLGVLIADLDEASLRNVQSRFLFPRVEALAGVRDDPRIASVMVRMAPRIEAGGAWRKFVPQCVRGLYMAADPRCVAQLDRAIADSPTAPALVKGRELAAGSKALRRLRTEMQDGPPPLPPELLSVVSAIRTSIESIPPDLVIATSTAKADGADPVALLAEVRASPDDHELRLVLADALMSIGDPLGEFIVLQCRRANGEDMEDKSRTLSRERCLLKEHLRTWVGPLSSVVTLGSAVFERGFLDRCEAVATKRVTAEVHFQHVEWATVRSIRFRGESRITPAMRSLREALGVDTTCLAQLVATGHPRLERLGLNVSALWETATGPTPNDTIQALATCEKLPALAHLELDIPRMNKARTEWIWKAPWRRQLRSIGVPSNDLALWVEELRRRDHLEEISFLGDAHRVIVRKQSAGVAGFAVTLRVEKLPLYSNVERELHETLRSLAALDRFRDARLETAETIRLPDGQRQRLEQALSRFK